MRVLITGGAGFIGSNLAKYLVTYGNIKHVRILDDLSTGKKENLADLPVELIVSSVLDFDGLISAAKGMDVLVHLAAIPSVPRSLVNPRASHEANTTGTLNVLEAARLSGTGQVIVASSSSVYGSNGSLPKNEFDWTRPMSPYGVTKLATEAYAAAYAYSYGVRTLAFRFFNVYGPGQSANHDYAAVIPRFITAALANVPLEIHGDGLQSRDFTYVETVCRVLGEAIAQGAHEKHPVNLAFGTNTTLLELVAILEDALGRELDRIHVEPRIGDVHASQADPSRLREMFPELEPVGLDKGIADTVAWFRDRA